MSNGIYGDTTRELWELWSKTMGPVEKRASSEVLLSMFNSLNLFPSQSQIFEMIQCARECANPCDSSDRSSKGSNVSEKNHDSNDSRLEENLTFGEFCVFASELKKYYMNHEKKSSNNSDSAKSEASPNSSRYSFEKKRTELRTQKSSASAYDVFLGGSCNPTTWRQDTAIPYLKTQGITFYNPQQSNWVPEMIELEHQAKQTSQILFFVMNELTRNVVSMIEVAYLAGANRRLIVVINPYPGAGHLINGESLSEMEFAELSQGLTTVHDLVERQGLPVFDDINVALNCSAKVLKDDRPIEDLGLNDNARPVKLAHLQIGDKLLRLREAFDTLDTQRSGKISLADLRMAFRIHAHRELTHKDLQQILLAHDVTIPSSRRRASKSTSNLPLDQVMIDFDHFCCIVSEFKHLNLSRDASLSRERGKKATQLIHSIAHPFQRLSHCISTPFSRGNHRPRKSLSNQQQPNLKRRGSQIRDVYLGGTMRNARWREKDAIPMLKKHGLTYFNPLATNTSSSSPSTSKYSMSFRCRRLIPIETAAMDNSRVLLFVILASSRSVGAMCEAAYYIGRGANVVLCVQKIVENEVIETGEKLSKAALKDYNRGRSYLSDIANREGVPVFEEVQEAVDCILQKCKSPR